MNLLDLPLSILGKIFSYLSFDEIAKLRLICTKIDKVCQELLNLGFNRAKRVHSKYLATIKALLPRRESQRRNHPLSKQVDILTCIETRISMLDMTYNKYVDLKLCCFIPGKVIDEILYIMNLVKNTKILRTHTILQELRDLSSMAIEHFDVNIAKSLKNRYLERRIDQRIHTIDGAIDSPTSSNIVLSELIFIEPSLQSLQYLQQIQPKPRESTSPPKTTVPIYKCIESRKIRNQLIYLGRRYKSAVQLMKSTRAMQRKQSQILKNNSIQISELSTQIIELKRRLEESDAKNRNISNNYSETNLVNEESTVNIFKPQSVNLKRKINESGVLSSSSCKNIQSLNHVKKSKLKSCDSDKICDN